MPRPRRIPPRKDATKATALPPATLSAVPPHVSSPKSKQSSSNSDDSDGLVTTRPGAVKTRNPLYRMSGAVPEEDVIQNGKRSRPIRGQQRKALNRIAREDEAATRAIEALRKRMQEEEDRKKTLKEGVSQAQVTAQISQAAYPAPPATLQVQRSQPEVEVEQDLQRAMPGSAWKRTSRMSAAPMSVRKPMSTPRAEASMLALANFKRRSRAPSILGIGNDDDTASISSEGSFGDLVVDDESTPLPQMRTQVLPKWQTGSPDGVDEAEPRTSSSRKRKRGSAEFHVPDSQPESHHDEGIQPPQSPSMSPIEIASDRSSSPSSDDSLPELMPETPKQSSHTPSSTMAPPESSSPVKPAAEERTKNVSSPSRGSSAKTSAFTPGVAKTWNRRNPRKASKPVDTAALQSLLPRRRQKKVAEGDWDIYDSDDGPGAGSDADELSFAPTKRQANKRSRQALSEKKAQSTNTNKTCSGQKASAKGVTPRAKSTRTYQRRQSEKENDPAMSDDDDDESGVQAAEVEDSIEAGTRQKAAERVQPSKALQAMAQKFAEVDNWEMEFEEVTGSSDSLKNAR